MTAIRLLYGDMREVLSSIDASSIDAVITDPPYGETSLSWDRWPAGWPALVRRVVKPSGSMWVFGSFRMFWDRAADFSGWHLVQDLVWEKHNGSGFLPDRFRRVHECAVQFVRDDAVWVEVYKDPQFTLDATPRTVRRKSKPAHWTGARGPSFYVSEDGGPKLMRSVIFARSEHGRAVHPMQKPIPVVEPLLLYSCPPGGIVLDPFAGSGTTGLVARRNSRRAVLIEADQHFFDVANDRIHGEFCFAAQ